MSSSRSWFTFHIQDLLIDWRLGAEWFESMLVDHDVTSNYGRHADR